ncbi:hypothetical protein [Synechococcus elongatus]|uniref:hypothetical protein n=1 Tax=Synechococcus elongatus TaxID=32046 RepID=UPI00268D8DA0
MRRGLRVVNAAEQATNVQLASKIATLVNLFKQQFPDARADLKPWRNDPETEQWLDPDSIDIGFHLPGWSPRFQSRSILVQVRLLPTSETGDRRLLGIDAVGLSHVGEQWRLSTIADWQIRGPKTPASDVCDRLKQFCRQTFDLFNASDSQLSA